MFGSAVRATRGTLVDFARPFYILQRRVDAQRPGNPDTPHTRSRRIHASRRSRHPPRDKRLIMRRPRSRAVQSRGKTSRVKRAPIRRIYIYICMYIRIDISGANFLSLVLVKSKEGASIYGLTTFLSLLSPGTLDTVVIYPLFLRLSLYVRREFSAKIRNSSTDSAGSQKRARVHGYFWRERANSPDALFKLC